MDAEMQQLITFELVPVLRAAIARTTDLADAIHVLSDRLDRLTSELALGELAELSKLAARALRVLEDAQIGGRT
jgi:hypothetical protein